jgi:TonB family protein
MFLIFGILASLVFPFINFTYQVPIVAETSTLLPEIAIPNINLTEGTTNETTPQISWGLYVAIVFFIGVLFFLVRIFKQCFTLYKVIKSSGFLLVEETRVVKTDAIKAPFSFFSYVFVNPSTSANAIKEIVKHEAEHIRQYHWIDLILAELISMVQWFNPFVWAYGRFIRQNHEYLADKRVLQRSENPAIYKAVLLNHILGGEVIRLGHSFSYSLNKKRFSMMTNKQIPTIRKIKALLIIPIIGIAFYAFAKPEYVITNPGETSQVEKTEKSENTVSGFVYREDGTPLKGASIIIKGTSTGTISDENGAFKLSEVPLESQIVISFVGLVTQSVEPDSKNPMKITLPRANINLENVVVVGYGKIPNAPAGTTIEIKHHDSSANDKPLLYILDGKEVPKSEIDKLNPDDIESISVLKNHIALDIYGDKAKNGVVEIALKKVTPELTRTKQADKAIFVIVEEMPAFPGGQDELMRYLATSIRYPVVAQENRIQGRVLVQFLISDTGHVSDATVISGIDPSVDKEALRVVQSMPAWKPGKQRGIPVYVSYTLPINFVLQ